MFSLNITTPAQMKAFVKKLAKQGKASPSRLAKDIGAAFNFPTPTQMYAAMDNTELAATATEVVLHYDMNDNLLEAIAVPDGVTGLDALEAAAGCFALDDNAREVLRAAEEHITTRSFMYVKPLAAFLADHEDESDELLCCDNCGNTKKASQLPDAQDVLLRQTRGGLFSDKECDRCEALAFPVPTLSVITAFTGKPAAALNAIRQRGLPAALRTTTNTNCLSGMACPACLSPGGFIIDSEGVSTEDGKTSVEVAETWHDDGTDGVMLQGSITMAKGGTCTCLDCGHEGITTTFQGFTHEDD